MYYFCQKTDLTKHKETQIEDQSAKHLATYLQKYECREGIQKLLHQGKALHSPRESGSVWTLAHLWVLQNDQLTVLIGLALSWSLLIPGKLLLCLNKPSKYPHFEGHEHFRNLSEKCIQFSDNGRRARDETGGGGRQGPNPEHNQHLGQSDKGDAEGISQQIVLSMYQE